MYSIVYKTNLANLPVGYVLQHFNPINTTYTLTCDGKSLQRTAYPQLFNVIGTSFGGVGSTFNLPSLDKTYGSTCIMCKQFRSNHSPADNHPFCNSTLDYLEYLYDTSK